MSQSSFVSYSSEISLNMILKDLFVLFMVSTLSLVTTSQPTPEGRDPEITKFHVTSKIQLRYASTEVLSHMSNPSSEVQEVTFEIRLPEKAFIHAFSMMVTNHKCTIGQILFWRWMAQSTWQKLKQRKKQERPMTLPERSALDKLLGLGLALSMMGIDSCLLTFFKFWICMKSCHWKQCYMFSSRWFHFVICFWRFLFESSTAGKSANV